MHPRPSSTVRRTAALRFALFCLAATLKPVPAHALPPLDACHPTDSLLVCRLKSVLTVLYTAAGILAFLLVIAVFAAIFVYRRNSRKLKIKDINPDAD